MPTAIITKEGHIQICLNCKKEFGSNETHHCFRCESYICPHCRQCSCFKTDGDIPWYKEKPSAVCPDWILQLESQMIKR